MRLMADEVVTDRRANSGVGTSPKWQHSVLRLIVLFARRRSRRFALAARREQWKFRFGLGGFRNPVSSRGSHKTYGRRDHF